MDNSFKISSIVIAKNEELNISRCIKSQLSCIDEIIVCVDETSTDRTEEIVKGFPGVKCFITKWKGYAGSKEYAVSLASNDWIFWIDADEQITPELNDELMKFKKSSPPDKAYRVARKAFFLGRWMKRSGWYPSRVTRLFDKNFAHFSAKNVHEHLLVQGTTGNLKSDLNHFTDSNIVHYFKKFNTYTSLAAKELYENGRAFKVSDITIRPFLLFIKMYIIKRGFMDGIQGFLLAVFSSLYVFTKYSKLWELRHSHDKNGEGK